MSKAKELGLQIVESTVYPGVLSLRVPGHHSAVILRQQLVAAGFKAGDRVVLRKVGDTWTCAVCSAIITSPDDEGIVRTLCVPCGDKWLNDKIEEVRNS